MSIEVGHHLETIQLLSLISDHSGQGLIWNKDPSVPLFLQLVLPDVCPDEAHNLAPRSFGPANDSLEVGGHWVFFEKLLPSRVNSTVPSSFQSPVGSCSGRWSFLLNCTVSIVKGPFSNLEKPLEETISVASCCRFCVFHFFFGADLVHVRLEGRLN